MKKKEYMSEEFYNSLTSIIKECEAHPYATTNPYDGQDGWEYRISKKSLGEWDEEQSEILLNQKDERVNNLLAASSLDCFLYLDRGGYIYFVFS